MIRFHPVIDRNFFFFFLLLILPDPDTESMDNGIGILPSLNPPPRVFGIVYQVFLLFDYSLVAFRGEGEGICFYVLPFRAPNV